MAAPTHIPAMLLAAMLASTAAAESVVAARTIPARSIITAADLQVTSGKFPGSLSDPARAVGLEAQVTLYQGRPVSPGDVGPPAMVERNDIVALVYMRDGLQILTDGRVLDRAAIGDRVRVMNLGSRITVTGTVTGPGEITVR
jgi:flagellar basal body P-ring formation protein FlgA